MMDFEKLKNKPLIIVITNDYLPDEWFEQKNLFCMTIVNDEDFENVTALPVEKLIILQGLSKKQTEALLKTQPTLLLKMSLKDKIKVLTELGVDKINVASLNLLTTKQYFTYHKLNINFNMIRDNLSFDKNKNDYEYLKNLLGVDTVRTRELKKLLTSTGFVNSIRTADRRINEWLEEGILSKVSGEERNFLVRINENY